MEEKKKKKKIHMDYGRVALSITMGAGFTGVQIILFQGD